MRLHSLSLSSFRSYQKLDLAFGDSSRQLLLGLNGSGKTNIIEAIALLSRGRSCLRADFDDMLRYEDMFFKVRADTEEDDGTRATLECVFQTSPRRASATFVNDVRTPLLSFIGKLPTIVFLPQDLDLFTGPPAGRRNFADLLLSQLRPTYAESRMEYERVLKQRSALLRRIAEGSAKESELDLWDERLLGAAEPILKHRSDLLSAISDALLSELQKLGETWQAGSIDIVPSAEGPLADALKKYRSRDIILQSTTVGPHRDDWRVRTDGHDIAHTASRGQQRATLLALLFVSAELFQSVRNEKPVILLDDVLSELDLHHQSALLKHLQGHQVFITSTHTVDHADGITVWKVAAGSVTESKVRAKKAP